MSGLLDMNDIKALLMKPVAKNSPEARTEGMLAATDKEVSKLIQYGAVGLNKIQEWHSVIAQFEGGLTKLHLMPSHAILGVKNIERPPHERKNKARIVGDGNRLSNGFGHRVTVSVKHDAPASLGAVRCVMFWSMTQEDGVCLLGDAENAYVKSALPTEFMTFLLLDSLLCPKTILLYV